MVQNYAIVLLCCSSYIVWHWISHSAHLCISFLLKLEINFFIKTNKQTTTPTFLKCILHVHPHVLKSWPINPSTTGEMFSLMFSFLRFSSSVLMTVDCVSAQMLLEKCIFKVQIQIFQACVPKLVFPHGQVLSWLSQLQDQVLHCTRAQVNLWELWDRCLEMNGSVKNPAGDWVKPVYLCVPGKSALWWESCSVPYLQSFVGLLSDSGWWFLNVNQNNCTSSQSLSKRWSIKFVIFQTHFPFCLWCTYTPSNWKMAL